MQPIRVGFLTIGCRANQADTAAMLSSLPSNAVEADHSNEICDAVIINTCAVTSRAEADARKLIRRARRNHPESKILVTGCAVQINPEKWLSMPEVDMVIGIGERDNIGSYLTNLEHVDDIHVQINPGGTIGVDNPTPLKGHKSRPFLKIQDGCSRGCAYCIVPYARGQERSRTPAQIRNDIRLLAESGYREIVLTGIHLGRWGIDLGHDLSNLLDILEHVESDVRFRLSSLEPMDLNAGLIKRILENPHICPHLHLPLQSGDQGILDSMGRGHTLGEYEKLIETAIQVNQDTALGADILIGFPGEDDPAFRNTLSFLAQLPLTYLHVFPFSPRENTPAFTMSGRPPGPIVRERMNELKTLDAAKRNSFLTSQNGSVRLCLVENPDPPESLPTAISDNYIRLNIESSYNDQLSGQVIPFRIDIIDKSGNMLPVGALLPG